MTTRYPYHITVAVPEPMAHEGNSLALCLGEQPNDDQTFVNFGYMIVQEPDPDGLPVYEYPTRVSVTSTRVTETFMQAMDGTDPIETPSYRPDADTAAAERGRDAIRLSGKMTPSTIGARPEFIGGAVLESIGVTYFEWEPVNVNTCEIEWLEALDGVGPVLAQAIVDNRPYSSVNDMMRVSGISGHMVDDWDWRITA